MNKQITVPNICKKHQHLLVVQADYSRQDPWQALIIASNITLFQAATADPKTHERIGGDIEKIGTLGCLACYKPDVFGEIVEAAKTHDLKNIKAIGDKYVEKGAKQ